MRTAMDSNLEFNLPSDPPELVFCIRIQCFFQLGFPVQNNIKEINEVVSRERFELFRTELTDFLQWWTLRLETLSPSFQQLP